MRALVFMSAVVALLTSSVGAYPGAAPKSLRVMSGAAMRIGRSVGSPTVGHLMGGAHLDETSYLRVVPSYAAGDIRWGLGPLVSMIDRSARAVRRQFPDATMSVGHLSRAGGGELDRHASHESGRDADIAFYLRNHLGKPLTADHFVSFHGDGLAPTWPGASFDDARNWALVAALVTDPVAHVSHIFVASPLRARLLAHAEKIGAPASVRVRASELLMQPRGSLPHDDHFHVRISCPPGMSDCVENPTAKRAPTFAKAPTPHPRNRGNLLAPPPAKPEVKPRPTPLAPPAEPPPAILSSPIDDADGDL